MFRVAGPLQLVSRIPSGITPKLVESCSQIFNAWLPYCTTTTPIPVFGYSKPNKKSFRTVYSPFRIHYDVDQAELVHVVQHILPELRLTSKEKLNDLLKFLKEKDCKWDDVKKDWSILDFSRFEVQQRFRLLEEFFFLKPNLPQVLHIGAYLQTKVESLRVQDVYSDEFDLIGNLLKKFKVLELPEAVVSKIKSNFQDVEKYTLADIHVQILVHYLSHRFMVDVEVVKDSFRINKLPLWKPLLTYARICDVLINILKMDFSHVIDHPLLLDIRPNNVLQMVKMCPPICNIPMVEFVKIYPTILQVPYKNILIWAQLFEKYKARKFFLTPNIVHLLKSENFMMVEERLMILHKMPEYEVIMMSKHFISLLYKPQAIKKLVEALYSGRVTNSLGYILSDSSSTRDSVPVMTIPPEMKLYIADKLGFDEKDPDFALLDKVRTNLGLNNTRMVLSILLDYGFTREQVMGTVQILSYQYSEVKATLEELPVIPEIQPYADWKETLQVMDLIAYLVAKRTNVW